MKIILDVRISPDIPDIPAKHFTVIGRNLANKKREYSLIVDGTYFARVHADNDQDATCKGTKFIATIISLSDTGMLNLREFLAVKPTTPDCI